MATIRTVVNRIRDVINGPGTGKIPHKKAARQLPGGQVSKSKGLFDHEHLLSLLE
jgi:hypothetical protein